MIWILTILIIAAIIHGWYRLAIYLFEYDTKLDNSEDIFFYMTTTLLLLIAFATLTYLSFLLISSLHDKLTELLN